MQSIGMQFAPLTTHIRSASHMVLLQMDKNFYSFSARNLKICKGLLADNKLVTRLFQVK